VAARYICVHGHFYQPPRENPWLEDVEVQDSAHPYHDLNERITFECYSPNAASRMLDEQGRIVDIVDNYRKISFNFGPTLLSWMERRAPELHDKIVQADRLSVKDRSGHGNALAQVYNHIIMPLASRRDKITQVRWGVRDFERRFGRKPEGMWLAETAADSESLEILADHGIKFTILSPLQARQVRPLTGGDWVDVTGGRVDPSRAYKWTSKSGKSLALFFYDAPIYRGVAFVGLLNSGDAIAQRLLTRF
jgi:alpha-amylase/alpha-mannosidase (GH57 family)